MSHLTIGTAGHVDHGKSALVEALTGVHPDRLKEERDRGMTIDLGFAFMPLGDGREVPIVDVPGHERFLKTMVAGVSGIPSSSSSWPPTRASCPRPSNTWAR